MGSASAVSIGVVRDVGEREAEIFLRRGSRGDGPRGGAGVRHAKIDREDSEEKSFEGPDEVA